MPPGCRDRAHWRHAATRPPRSPRHGPRGARPRRARWPCPAARSPAATFPDGWAAFHTYDELGAEVAAVAAAHPAIVRRFSIGRVLQGPRAVGGQDQRQRRHSTRPSPRSCSTASTTPTSTWPRDDARGSSTGSPTATAATPGSPTSWTPARSGSCSRSTPTAPTFDIKDGRFHHWRKNRQPNADGDRRHGPQPQLRLPLGRRRAHVVEPAGDHLPRAPRVLRARDPARCATSSRAGSWTGGSRSGPAITFHESGRLVMWPYGYTHKDVPADMTDRGPRRAGRDRPADGRAPTATAASRRATCTSRAGTTRDYLYGTYRVFAYTFELSTRDYPRTTGSGPRRGATGRPCCTCIERAWCPLGVLGRRRSATRAAARSTTTSRSARGLDGGPGRDRHGARVGPLAARQPGPHRRPAA